MKLNKHYSELNESYLFSTIAHKVAAYQKVNPDKDIIRILSITITADNNILMTGPAETAFVGCVEV